MSKIASFVEVEVDNVIAECRAALESARAHLVVLGKDPQKDGADSEALTKAFARIDRALEGLR